MASEFDLKLIDAAHYKFVGGIKFFLKKGADVNSQDQDGKSPIHWAVERKHMETLEALLEAKPNLALGDKNGDTPLHLAARAGDMELIRRLVKAGASIHQKNGAGETPAEISKKRAAV